MKTILLKSMAAILICSVILGAVSILGFANNPHSAIVTDMYVSGCSYGESYVPVKPFCDSGWVHRA